MTTRQLFAYHPCNHKTNSLTLPGLPTSSLVVFGLYLSTHICVSTAPLALLALEAPDDDVVVGVVVVVVGSVALLRENKKN